MERRIEIALSWGSVSALEWTHGSAADRAVLLLHGGGTDSASLSWGGIGGRIAGAGYRVIAPDHPGHGRSPSAPWPVTQERLVEHVGEVVDALALERPAIGGLSLGGGMAIGHALRQPGRVSGAMVLGGYGIMPRLGAGWLSRPAQLLGWALVRSGLMPALMRSYASSPARMERGLRDLVRDADRRTPELVAEAMHTLRREGALETFQEWQRDEVLWNRLRTDYSSRLGALRAPVLLVHGESDAGVPLAAARRAERLLPDARLVVAPGAGHWVQRDAPDVAVAAMTGFLDSLER
ncbi:alpha/beta hydrolase [Microbacterium betulae]|uniref:Alpha/beta hydrolase n=1 Tax=Microbacterium betulae TaxID=2981139 RepID=A0AA97I7I9_9MICO|nr:alpha/beta hydrolase [Microbacterium sp. AB]WOF23672.1 alpha/beta hydrolase [Microbacterium sp. AB]